MLRSLVGSEMCIRDRFMECAQACRNRTKGARKRAEQPLATETQKSRACKTSVGSISPAWACPDDAKRESAQSEVKAEFHLIMESGKVSANAAIMMALQQSEEPSATSITTQAQAAPSTGAVSYTHLTLPTKRIV
eukprot:TRINITY_DN63988_c0_g1_i1.p1 TRINITY_DN63988_c0_g1~~TRINITY_DN63988_c0_g1_i1.p1  ORF type:complete len:148 (-),score=47.47 TRINITY_DN63988_c0_g1_i1:37-441(-)